MDEPIDLTADEPAGDDASARGASESATPEEAMLASTLRAHADRVEPDPGSLLRLRQRVEATEAAPRRRFGFASQQLAIAAVILAVVIGGVAALSRTAGQQLETEPAETTIAPLPSQPTTTTASDADDSEDDSQADARDLGDDLSDAVDPDLAPNVGVVQAIPPADGFIAGPIRRTREEAATAFMALIRQPYGRIDVSNDRATVISLDEAGDIGDQAVAELFFESVTTSDGSIRYAVAEARSTGMTIASPAPGSLVMDPTITVAGEGSGFEAGIVVSLISSFDGLMLDIAPGLAGWETAPYEVEVQATGTEHGWIVAYSSIPVDFVTPPFSAVPIAWELEPDPTTYTVSHIEPDDPDGGLNVRNAPDLDESEVLEVLPAGTSGIRRRGGLPAFVDGAVFWSVTTPSGGEGWVNRRFLVRDGLVDDEILESIGFGFAEAVTTGDPWSLTLLPWSNAKPVLIGWAPGMTQVVGGELAMMEFWSTPRSWTVPEETFGRGSIDERPDTFLSPAFALTSSVRAGEDTASSPYPLVQRWIDSRFAGLQAVEVTATDLAGGDVDRSFTLFVEPGPEGPQIVGVVVHLWTP